MISPVFYILYIALLVVLLFSAVILPLSIKYVRHRHFAKYIAQSEADEMAMQNITETLLSTNAYLFHLDDQGRLRFGSRLFQKFNLHDHALSVSTIARILDADSKQTFLDVFQNLDEKGKEVYLKTYSSKLHEPHYFVLFVQKVSSGGKELVYGLFYLIDHFHVQQDEMREALRREEDVNLKSSFLASMGHEIRTPLNAIVGFSRMLVENRKTMSEEEFSTIRETITRSNKQLLDLLDNVMKYSANSDKKLDIPLTPKTVQVLMDEIYTMHTVIVPKQLEFKYEPGNSDDMVVTNRSSLIQIVSNLMNNAIKFTPTGSITLGWRGQDDRIIIYVRDTGIGIAEENHEKIFDKYFKNNSMMAGAGIGLSLCKRLTEAMNGTISVKSKLDEGSCFEINLPRYNGK